METFYINDAKLGFKLDKNTQTPTINNITIGGALEKELIESCSTISLGSEIITINSESIIGLNYEQAMAKIKSFNERPIEMSIRSPKKVSPIKKISSEEMNKISKQATQEALQNLVKYQLDKDESEEDSDDDFRDDKLEEKYRMLEFQKMNIEIELNKEILSIKKVHEPLILINDYILTANKFYDINHNYFYDSSREITNNLQKIKKDFNESLKLINEGKKNINYMGCQILVDTYIEKITFDFNKLNFKLTKLILFKNIIEWFQFISIIIILTTGCLKFI